MALDPMTAVFELGETVIDKIWPDPAKQAEEKRKLAELYQKGDLAQLNAHVKLMTGQLEVNKAEAAHGSIFVAGWRPWIGWVGGTALAYQFVVYPFLIWIWALAQAKGYIPVDLSAPPVLDTGPLMTIITGMLGIGAMRSYDKAKGVDTKRVKK